MMQRIRALRRIARKKEKRVRSGRRDIIGWRRTMMRRTKRRGKRLWRLRDGRINERLISRMGEVGVRGGRLFESGCRMSIDEYLCFWFVYIVYIFL